MRQCHYLNIFSIRGSHPLVHILCSLSPPSGKLLVTPFHKSCEASLYRWDQLLPLSPCLLSFIVASFASTVGHPSVLEWCCSHLLQVFTPVVLCYCQYIILFTIQLVSYNMYLHNMFILMFWSKFCCQEICNCSADILWADHYFIMQLFNKQNSKISFLAKLM